MNLAVCLVLTVLSTSCNEDESLYVLCPETCYSGESWTEGVGICRPGVPVCDDAGNVIECAGEVLPSHYDTCNNVDDDCDGSVDENLYISPYESDNACKQCGKCRSTTERCIEGVWVCEYDNGPPAALDDTCNNVDDDCDCEMDEDVYPEGEIVFCYGGPEGTVTNGECRPGVEACIDGITFCDGEVRPTDERCNQRDDDCNGFTDDVTTIYEYVAMVLAVDISGSMGDELDAVTGVICDYASQGANASYKFALALIAEPDGDFSLVQNMTDAATLCEALQDVTLNGGTEPTLSTAEAVVDPTNPLMIDWPENSKRIFVGFGDENAQVLNGTGWLGNDPDASITNTLAYCAASETDIYWFVQSPEFYDEQAFGCGGQVFQLTAYEPWMLEDMNTIISEVCLESAAP